MGIKRGVVPLRTAFSNGLYNNKMLTANDVRVYVDGDNLLYKGFVLSSKCSTDAERSIACRSVSFLKNIIAALSERLHVSTQLARRVTVVLDAEQRVANKEWRIDHSPLDRERLRSTYCKMCESQGYNVQVLQEGEAEHQMYLQRDRSMRLNVFVSCDTDTFSICYGHKPIIAGDACCFDRRAHTEPISFHELDGNSSCRLTMYDSNLRYVDSICDYVRDSCLVLQNTCDKYYLFGMDYCEDYVGYTRTAFQTLAALCGTDFTDAMFTPTMAREVLSAKEDQIEFINNQGVDIVRLTAAMVLVAVQNGATLSRSGVGNTLKLVDGPAQFYRILTENTEQYIKYIRTGVMDGRVMIHINMHYALRTMMADIYQRTIDNRAVATSDVKLNYIQYDDKTLVNWIKKQKNLNTLIDNMTPATFADSRVGDLQDGEPTTAMETEHDRTLNFLSPEQIFELEQATMDVDLNTLYWSTELESLVEGVNVDV